MWQLTHFEIRACVIALLAYGLLAALVPAPPPRPPLVTTIAPGVEAAAPVAGPAQAPPASVPPITTQVDAISRQARTVALTFDDGPDPRWTPQVLDLLGRHHAVAMFCVVGENAVRHPELVSAIVAAGMRLCDHTRAHRIDPASPESGMAHAELVELAGTDVSWFRAPGGVWSPAVQSAAGAAGMRPLGWSVDSRDWTKPGVEEIVQRVQREVRPGAVVLLHDGGGQREQTVAALDVLLPWLVQQCYVTTFPDGR